MRRIFAKEGLRAMTVALAALLAAVMLSCGSVQSRAAGTAELAQLELVGTKTSSVRVSIDGGEYFSASVNKPGKHSHQYTIPSGTHEIQVLRGGEVIVSKTIFSSAGEVKVVELP